MTEKLPHGSVVVGVYGSAQSNDALLWAVDQAVLEHRPLVIAHATGRPQPLLDSGKPDRHQGRRIVGRRHVDDAFAVARKRASGLRVETLVRPTTAQLMLMGLADQAHLVVVGSRGLGPIGSVALRSVSVAVASGSDAPVVVVRGYPPSNASARIIVGTDAAAASTAAMEFGFAQASRVGAHLTVVHCTTDAVLGLHAGDLPPEEVAYHTQERLRLAESVAGLREKYIDVPVDLRVARGPASEYLVEASRDASMVVVGARGHHALGASFLGSVSQAVIERAHCSVAVVHPRSEATHDDAAGRVLSTRQSK
jgi:nucleotide-binding universal stress UspA family protein